MGTAAAGAVAKAGATCENTNDEARIIREVRRAICSPVSLCCVPRLDRRYRLREPCMNLRSGRSS